MSTGPDNVDALIERYSDEERDQLRYLAKAVPILIVALVAVVLFFLPEHDLGTPCTGSQTHACTERLPPR